MTTQAVDSPRQTVHPPYVVEFIGSRFNYAMGIATSTLIIVEIVLARVAHLSGTAAQLLDVWPGLLMLIACVCYCRWRPLPKLIEASELAIWAVILTNVLSLLIQIAGRSPRPLIDHALATLDGRIHFNTAFFVHLMVRLPILKVVLASAYAVTPVLIIAAIMLPPFCGHANATRRYVIGIVVAAIFTAVLFALWPAAVPWTTQPLTPTRDQAAVTAYLMLLKSGAPVTLDMEKAGIVAFPSFHIVFAILSAAALGSIRWIRIPIWVLAALICISTITTGWHYGIDVFGGFIVAIASLCAARRIVVSLA